MKKSVFPLLAWLLASLTLTSQTTSKIEQPLAVGAADPVASAMLDVQATNKGLLVPRMTTVQRTAIGSPAVGLLVFDTDENDFFFHNGAEWGSLEKQTISKLGSTVTLSNGGGTFTDAVDDADANPTNELQTLAISGNDLSISAGNTVSLYGVNLLGNCGTDKTCFGNTSNGDATFGIGTCPDGSARLHIKDEDSANRTGIKVELTNAPGQNTNRKGMDMKVENGSNTNDGIVLLSRGNSNASGISDSVVVAINSASSKTAGARLAAMNGARNLGMNIRVDDLGNGTNSNGSRNIGLRIDNKDNDNNDANATDTLRDVALLVISENKTEDYAAWFEGNVGIKGAATSQVPLRLTGGLGCSLASGGNFQSGPTNGNNIVIDGDEIMARNNGAVANLILNSAGGSVGIGTLTPDVRLHVVGGTDAGPNNSGGYIQAGDFNESNIAIDNNEIMARNNGAASLLYLNHGGGDIKIGNASSSLGIGVTPTANPLQMESGAHCTAAGAWTNASDRRLKTHIADLDYGLGDLMALRPVRYRMKKGGESQIGFIAQEVQGILPELVSGTEGDPEKGETLGLNYANMTAVLVNAVQEQQAIIEEQRSRLERLEKEMAEMKVMMRAMVVGK